MHQPDRRFDAIIGAEGSGKTSLAKIRLFDHDRAFVMDPRNQYGFLPHYSDCDALADAVEGREFFMVAWNGADQEIDYVCDLANAAGPSAVLLDEGARYRIAPQNQPQPHPRYHWTVTEGRSPANISLIVCAQRPQELAACIRSNATDIFCGNMVEPEALRWLRPALGDAVHELPNMPYLHFKHWQRGQVRPEIAEIVIKF